MTAPELPEAGVNNLWYDDTQSRAVIVFVHGILSDSRTCWLHHDAKDASRDRYWPEIVRTDSRFASPSIYLGGYYTAIDSGPYEIKNCAEELAQGLRRVDEQGHPAVMTKDTVVFVCHSTGGLVVRYLLESRYADFTDKLVGVVLIASPSYGSDLADRLGWLARFYNQQLGIQLEWGNWSLRDLDTRFKTLVSEKRIPRLVGVEGYENHFIFHRRFLPDKKVVVTEESAGRYFGAPVLLRDTDHFTAVKPTGTRHPSHELLLDFWARHITPPPAPPAAPAAPSQPAFGLVLREMRQVHRYLNAAGDFEMETRYVVTNATPYDITVLFPDAVSFLVADPRQLEAQTTIECAIVGDGAGITSIALEHAAFTAMTITKVDGRPRSSSRIQWRPRISPPLAPGTTVTYTSTVRTRGTETAAFLPEGSFAGFATPFATDRLSFRCEAPPGYRFDPAVFRAFTRTEAGSSVALPSLAPPVMAGDGTSVDWVVPAPAIEVAVNYLMRIRFTPVSGGAPAS